MVQYCSSAFPRTSLLSDYRMSALELSVATAITRRFIVTPDFSPKALFVIGQHCHNVVKTFSQFSSKCDVAPVNGLVGVGRLCGLGSSIQSRLDSCIYNDAVEGFDGLHSTIRSLGEQLKPDLKIVVNLRIEF
jgi:hypothetical protein